MIGILVRRVLRVLLILLVGVTGVAAATLAVFRTLAEFREVHARQLAAPPTGRFVKAWDVELYVQEAGPADGPPVLFIHGLGAWSETWRETLTDLASAGYRAIAIDIPPFGYSERPGDAQYSTEAQSRRILALVDALRLRDTVLVGHSFGGRATMEAALQAPEHWRALVLVDVALGLQEEQVESYSGPLAWLMGSTVARETLVAATATNPLLTREILKRFTARHEVLTPARVAIYQMPFVLLHTTESFGDWAAAFLDTTVRPRSADPSAYRSLQLPALVLWGDQDGVTPLEQGRHLAQLLPRAQLRVLSGIGHIPQIEDITSFNRTLREYLDALPAR